MASGLMSPSTVRMIASRETPAKVGPPKSLHPATIPEPGGTTEQLEHLTTSETAGAIMSIHVYTSTLEVQLFRPVFGGLTF